jgi:site-specific recombinase XerC
MPHSATSVLRRLEAVLLREREALARFDVAGIGEAAHEKEELEPELLAALQALRQANSSGRLPADEVQAIRSLHANVVQLGRENHERLAATLTAVRGLVTAMVGDERPTYGPANKVRNPYQTAAPVRAVLTAEVG